MKTKKETQLREKTISDDVVNLGFVQNLANQMNVNALAASGINLSMREKLLAFMEKDMDKSAITKKEQNLMNVLKSS